MVGDVFLVSFFGFVCTSTFFTFEFSFLYGLAFSGNLENYGRFVVFLTFSKFFECDSWEYIYSNFRC